MRLCSLPNLFHSHQRHPPSRFVLASLLLGATETADIHATAPTTIVTFEYGKDVAGTVYRSDSSTDAGDNDGYRISASPR